MTTVFFYGLFMDQELLADKGLRPRNVRYARLNGYQLIIGERASLLEKDGACCFGTVMSLTSAELSELYAGDGVEDYQPEIVQITLDDGTSVSASTYILSQDKISGSNREYALKLAQTARELGLPEEYVTEILSWT